MNNLQKRILTALIALPLSIYLIIIGGIPLVFFLVFILFAGIYELFTVFKKTSTKLFLLLILILSLFSAYYLRENAMFFLYFAIAISISSDVGGYIFGKIFKWKKISKISPKKTLSGVLGSFLLSISSVFIMQFTIQSDSIIKWLEPKFFFIAIILSLTAQAGDLTISYFKRKEKIKDTGKILPGHGGIFDRIDSLMFVIILGFLLYNYKIIP